MLRPILIGGAFLLVSAVSPAEPPSIFTLAVLRRDATVVPFATYDGKRWENHWPQPGQDVDVPINLRSVPARWWGGNGPLDAWQVWTTGPPRLVRVRQPDWLQTHCQKQVGLRTTYQPSQRPPDADAQPYPKDGLAVWPPLLVETIRTLSQDSAERGAVADILRAGFAAREEAALTRARTEGSPVHASKKDLDALPITIEALYGFGTTRRVYWVEAVREYKEGGACAAIVFGGGWFVLESGRLTRGEFDVTVVPCSREGLRYMLPLGVISVARGQYWIAQWSGWDNEEYDVIEIGARAIAPVLAVWGGGC